jgi:hypothetical protein
MKTISRCPYSAFALKWTRVAAMSVLVLAMLAILAQKLGILWTPR